MLEVRGVTFSRGAELPLLPTELPEEGMVFGTLVSPRFTAGPHEARAVDVMPISISPITRCSALSHY